MKIIALGDTHGRPDWKTIVAETDFDKVVFLGDYFDSYEYISGQFQMKNFIELLGFKKANPQKVVLLIGNHDYQYLKSAFENYNSFNYFGGWEIEDLLYDTYKQNLIQVCYLYDKFLFTHAGVTRTWARVNQIDLNDVETSINELFRIKPMAFRYTPGKKFDPSADEICQTPIWVRPASLLRDRIEGFTQIVGHTIQPELILSDNITFIDTLGTSGQYLSITDGQMSVMGQKSDKLIKKYCERN